MVKKVYSYTSIRPMGRTACTEPQCLYNGYRIFPGAKERPGCDTDSSPPCSAVVKKE